LEDVGLGGGKLGEEGFRLHPKLLRQGDEGLGELPAQVEDEGGLSGEGGEGLAQGGEEDPLARGRPAHHHHLGPPARLQLP